MKNLFDLAAKNHALIKEAFIAGAAMRAGKSVAGFAGKHKAATLGTAMTTYDAGSAASAASRGVQEAHNAARQMASSPQLGGTM